LDLTSLLKVTRVLRSPADPRNLVLLDRSLEVEVGKAVLRDYINATVGFESLAKATGTPSKSLMRMFGPKGNPRANNLFAVIGKLRRVSGVRLAVASVSRRRAA
jgi:DNA-binding phage protein